MRPVRCMQKVMTQGMYGVPCFFLGWDVGRRVKEKQAKGLGPNLPLLSYNRPDREGKGREGKQGKMLSCTLLAEQYC